MATGTVYAGGIEYKQHQKDKSVSASTYTEVCELSLEPGTWLITFYCRANVNNSALMAVMIYDGSTSKNTARTSMSSGGGCMTNIIVTLTQTKTYYGRVYFGVAATATGELNAIRLA